MNLSFELNLTPGHVQIAYRQEACHPDCTRLRLNLDENTNRALSVLKPARLRVELQLLVTQPGG